MSGWIVFGPEEVFVDDESLPNLKVPGDTRNIRDGEWVGTEKEWREFIDRNDLTVETSDEDYAIINNKAVFVGVEYDDYGSRGHFDDEY